VRCFPEWGYSSRPPHAGFHAAKYFCKLHRPEIPNLDAYVKLARQPLQATVTMAMQVGPTFAHIPPGPEGIVAQDEVTRCMPSTLTSAYGWMLPSIGCVLGSPRGQHMFSAPPPMAAEVEACAHRFSSSEAVKAVLTMPARLLAAVN